MSLRRLYTETVLSGASFSTPWFNTLSYTELSLNIRNSLDSVDLGLKYEQSNDGITAIKTISCTSLAATFFVNRQLPVQHDYVRITFVNDTVGDNDVEIELFFDKFRQLAYTTQSAPVPIGQTSLAVRQVGDFELDISRSLDQAVQPRRTFYYGVNFSSGEVRDSWNLPGFYTFPTTASTLRIKAGGNAADLFGAGAGCWVCQVRGLNENWDEVEETILTNGASASLPTVNQYIRVNFFDCVAGGTYRPAGATVTNVGDIILERTSDAVNMSIIKAGVGSSLQGIFSIPRGFTCYLKSVSAYAPSSKTYSGLFKVHAGANVTTPPYDRDWET
jgi:hypothetical protein